MKTAVVTGASGGIGKEFAILLAAKKYNLVLISRNEPKLLSLAKELHSKYGVRVEVIGADLSVAESAEKVYAEVKEKYPSVDLLINNAGFGDYGKFENSEIEKNRRMITLNISTLTELTGYFLKDMLQKKSGRILNIASTASFQPVPNIAVYAATKAYVLSFTEALHSEVKGSGVTVSALCPGATRTDFEKNANMGSSRLFSSGVMDAKTVAVIGYKKMMQNKMTIIPGMRNKVLALLSNMTPSRNLLVYVSSNISKEK